MPKVPPFSPQPLSQVSPIGSQRSVSLKERRQLLLSLGASVGLHLLVLGMIALAFYFSGLRPYQIVAQRNASISAQGPAAPVSLQMIHLAQAPVLPLTQSPHTVPIPEKKMQQVTSLPQPPRPEIAPHAHDQGQSHALSRLVVGSPHFPAPQYPTEARDLSESGTVQLRLKFDPAGRIAHAHVMVSSGYADLDDSTRQFILQNWRDQTYAGQEVTVPVVYTLTQP